MSFSVSLQEGLSLWVVASIGLVDDGPLEPLLGSPVKGMALFLSFLLLLATCVYTISLGSQLCPAAASSTIYTSVSMVLGYVAQSIIHNQHPDALTKVGAALMLLAVALVAAGRWWQSKAVAARELEAVLLPEHACQETEEAPAANPKTESLASFIAAEFSGLDHASKSIRQRRLLVAAVETLCVTWA